MPRIKVLLDTNIFVSALINPNGPPAQIINAWLREEFLSIISPPILKEVWSVLNSPRIKSKYSISDNEIVRLIELISSRSEWINVCGCFKLCRHTNDDLILETAILGKAKYLISRDDDIKRDKSLIDAMRSNGIIVISVRSFITKLNNGDL